MPQTAAIILHSAGEGIYGLDSEGLTTFANPAAEAMIGWTAEELIGKPQHATIHHSHSDQTVYPREECPIYMALRDGLVRHSDSEVFWRKDGTCFPVAYTSTPILRDGVPYGAVVIFKDISERKRREAWQRSKNSIFSAITSHADLQATFRMMADAFIAFHSELSIAFFLRIGPNLKELAHGSACRTCSFSEQLIGQLISVCGRAAEGGREIVASCTHSDAGDPERILWNRLDVDGFNLCLAIPLLSCTGKVLGSIAVLSTCGDSILPLAQEAAFSVGDIARIAIEHHHLHTNLIRQSQHDALTGLPNRLLFEDRLDQALTLARRNGTQVAVCILDLDCFKQINDSVGHSYGDCFLQSVARILSTNVRDIDTVARQGGDEFFLVFPDLQSEREAIQICERILLALQEPILINGQCFTATASIGIRFSTASMETAGLLLRDADTTLYAAKQSGRNKIRQYDVSLGEKVQRLITLQTALRSALAAERFSLAYQPLYSYTMDLLGFEALLRWSHAFLGQISPADFIPIAEETGLIVQIGEWILSEACRQAQEWTIAFAKPIRIFINISGVQLSHPDFLDTVARSLARSGLAPAQLELEITESWIMTDIPAASRCLAEIRALGIGIAIDDFGTGHSSLACLQRFPVDTIKIDQSFVSRLDGSAQSLAIIRTIVELAGQLGLQTVAEGIETEFQLTHLQSLRCDIFQGYLLDKPLAPEGAHALLARGAKYPTLCPNLSAA